MTENQKKLVSEIIDLFARENNHAGRGVVELMAISAAENLECDDCRFMQFKTCPVSCGNEASCVEQVNKYFHAQATAEAKGWEVYGCKPQRMLNLKQELSIMRQYLKLF